MLMATLLGSAGAQSIYDQFFDEYYFPSNPTAATFAGVHDYDGKLEDYSKDHSHVAARPGPLFKRHHQQCFFDHGAQVRVAR